MILGSLSQSLEICFAGDSSKWRLRSQCKGSSLRVVIDNLFLEGDEVWLIKREEIQLLPSPQVLEWQQRVHFRFVKDRQQSDGQANATLWNTSG